MPGPWTITTSAGPGGSVAPSGAVSVVDGGSQLFTATPSGPSHPTASWELDGTVVQYNGNTETISSVTTNHTLIVAFGQQFELSSAVSFVAPKKISSYRCFGHITPQGTNVEDAAPPVYWPGTLDAGYYTISYLGGARHFVFDPDVWYLETAVDSSDGYELFYSGAQQTDSFPGAVTGTFGSPGAVESANSGLSYSFTHTGGQIGIAIDFTAYTIPGVLLPYFQLCGLKDGIDSDVYFVGGKTITLNSDVVFFTEVKTLFFSLESTVVFRRPPLAPGQQNLLSKYKEAQRDALLQKPCTTCGGIDCTDTEIAYSLEGAGLPLVPVCPTGVDCSKFGSGFHLQCCDGTRYDYNFSPEITDEQKRVIIANAMADCARKLPFCTNNCPNPPCDPPCLVPPCIIYGNHLATCPAECPGGGTFIESIAPGTYFAFTQIEADQIAVRAACALAKDHRLCFLGLESVICVDLLYSDEFVMSGKYVAAYPSSDIISVVDGALPNGIVLNEGSSFITGGRCKLEGTPTVAGTYTFTIGVTLNTFGSPGYGDHQQREYTIKVCAVTPDTLPDAKIGVAYSQNLSVTPSHDQETEVWSVVTSLPAGLTLTSAGILRGTPTGPSESHNVTVKCCFTLDSEPVCCTKQYTLTVKLGSELISYWKLDEVSGTRIDSKALNNLSIVGAASFGTGIIGNGFKQAAVNTQRIQVIGSTTLAPDNTKGFTICGWFNLVNTGTYSGIATLTIYDGASTDLMGFSVQRDLVSNPGAPGLYAVSCDDNGAFGCSYIKLALVYGVWTFFRYWVDPDTNKQYLQLDLGVKNEVALVVPFPASVKADFEIGRGGAGYIVDELGIWKGILTDADATYLYNSGAGRTYPDVPHP